MSSSSGQARGVIEIEQAARASTRLMPTATSSSDMTNRVHAGLKRRADDMSAATGAPEVGCILVRVGSAREFTPFRRSGLTTLDRGTLLTALAADDMFAAHFAAHVARGDCAITVMQSMSKEAPSPAEEAAGQSLRGAVLLGDLLRDRRAGSNVFVRVQLPADAASAATGDTAYVTAFATALQCAKVTPASAGCDVVSLLDTAGAPLHWPKLRSHQLFIRPVFKAMFEESMLLNSFRPRVHDKNDDSYDSIILGVPGIGKSSFGMYCVWRLVQMRVGVIYDYPKGLDNAGMYIAGAPGAPVVYIVDGITPRPEYTVGGRLTVLITSPCLETYAEFKKDALPLFMPTPTVEEVLAMRDVCFDASNPMLSDDAVKERISRWGCVPRWVLSKLTREEDELDEALRSQKLHMLPDLLRDPTSIPNGSLSFRLVHFDISSNYRRARCCWASDYVQERVWQRLLAMRERKRMALLSDLFSDADMLPQFSLMWEGWASIVMARGTGESGLEIRRLSDCSPSVAAAADKMLRITVNTDGTQLLPLPRADSLIFETIGELAKLAAAHPGMRYVAPRGFAALDFWEAIGVPSNATVSAKHELLLQGQGLHCGLRAVIYNTMLPDRADDDPIPFLWLVPSSTFQVAQAGAITVAKRRAMRTTRRSARVQADIKGADAFNAAVDAAWNLEPYVVQYAVRIPDPGDSV